MILKRRCSRPKNIKCVHIYVHTQTLKIEAYYLQLNAAHSTYIEKKKSVDIEKKKESNKENGYREMRHVRTSDFFRRIDGEDNFAGDRLVRIISGVRTVEVYFKFLQSHLEAGEFLLAAAAAAVCVYLCYSANTVLLSCFASRRGMRALLCRQRQRYIYSIDIILIQREPKEEDEKKVRNYYT